MKYTVKKIVLQVLSIIITMALCIGSWWLGLYLFKHDLIENRTPLIAVAVICGLIVVALFVANIVGKSVITKKLSGMKMQEIYDLGESLKSKTESDIRRAEKSARLTIALAYIYTIFIIIILLVCCFCTGTLLSGEDALSSAIVIMIVAIFLTWGLVNIFFTPFDTAFSSSKTTPPASFAIDEKRFPLILETVKSAAEKSGCRLKVRIYCYGDGASVSVSGRNAVICINYLYLALLTRDELYSVMLHEFAHIINEDTSRSRAFAKAVQRFEGDDNNPIVSFGKITLLPLVYALIDFKTDIYNTFANRTHEIEADKALKELGDPQKSINALAKTKMVSLFFSVPHRELSYDFFAPEKLTGDYAAQELSIFLKHRDLHEKEWREMLEKELPARVDSHPTFKNRMAALSCESYDAKKEETDPTYIAEQREIIVAADERMNEENEKHYDEIRKDAYLDRKKIIEEYEEAVKNGKEIPDNKLFEYIQAFFGIDDDIALQLADRASTLPNPTVANYYKANILFNRNDDGCIDLLKAIARSTDNMELAMSATEHLGEYALKTGNEELLNEYRRTTADIVQASRDKGERNRFGKNSTVTKCDIDDKALSEITGGIDDELLSKISEIYIGTFTDTDGKKHYPVAVRLKGRKITENYDVYQKLSEYLFGFNGKYDFILIPSYTRQFKKLINKVIEKGSCVHKK